MIESSPNDPWPNGKPEVGRTARRSRNDGTVVLDGDAVCYTMPIEM